MAVSRQITSHLKNSSLIKRGNLFSTLTALWISPFHVDIKKKKLIPDSRLYPWWIKLKSLCSEPSHIVLCLFEDLFVSNLHLDSILQPALRIPKLDDFWAPSTFITSSNLFPSSLVGAGIFKSTCLSLLHSHAVNPWWEAKWICLLTRAKMGQRDAEAGVCSMLFPLTSLRFRKMLVRTHLCKNIFLLKHRISLRKVETEKWTTTLFFPPSVSYKFGKFAGKNDNFYVEIQLKINTWINYTGYFTTCRFIL